METSFPMKMPLEQKRLEFLASWLQGGYDSSAACSINMIYHICQCQHTPGFTLMPLWLFFFPQRCSHQALDLHWNKGEQTLGHLIQRASGHPQGFYQFRSGALGLRHSRRRKDAQLHAGVALLHVQVGTSTSNLIHCGWVFFIMGIFDIKVHFNSHVIFISVSQIYSSGPLGASASEDQWATSVLHGPRLPGVTDGQSECWRLGQN